MSPYIAKAGVGLVLATQSLAALEPEVRAALLGVETIVCFRVGADDAEILAREFVHEVEVPALMRLDVTGDREDLRKAYGEPARDRRPHGRVLVHEQPLDEGHVGLEPRVVPQDRSKNDPGELACATLVHVAAPGRVSSSSSCRDRKGKAPCPRSRTSGTPRRTVIEVRRFSMVVREESAAVRVPRILTWHGNCISIQRRRQGLLHRLALSVVLMAGFRSGSRER